MLRHMEGQLCNVDQCWEISEILDTALAQTQDIADRSDKSTRILNVQKTDET